MQFDLAAMSRRVRNTRRSSVTFRDIIPPAVLASDLYAAAYRPVVTLWEGYGARIAAEYERTLSTLTTDAPADVTGLLDQADGEFSRLVLLLRPALRNWAIRLERYTRSKFIGAALAASGVDLTTLLGPEEAAQTLEQAIEWNVALVRDVGEQARQKIANAVFVGLTARSPAREVAKEIREVTGFARDRSMRIASHQLSSLTSQLAAERRRQAGIDIWEWRHSAKRHPRQDHLARNGDYYTDNPDMVGRVVDGKIVKASPKSDDLPGIKPFCGCRQRSVLVFS